jgi:hypothetical protein
MSFVAPEASASFSSCLKRGTLRRTARVAMMKHVLPSRKKPVPALRAAAGASPVLCRLSGAARPLGESNPTKLRLRAPGEASSARSLSLGKDSSSPASPGAPGRSLVRALRVRCTRRCIWPANYAKRRCHRHAANTLTNGDTLPSIIECIREFGVRGPS